MEIGATDHLHSNNDSSFRQDSNVMMQESGVQDHSAPQDFTSSPLTTSSKIVSSNSKSEIPYLSAPGLSLFDIVDADIYGDER